MLRVPLMIGYSSTRKTSNMSSQDGVWRYTKSRSRKPVLDVEGTSTQTRSLDRQEGITMLDAPIDLEAYDDDVIISSLRAFSEAKTNLKRTVGLLKLLISTLLLQKKCHLKATREVAFQAKEMRSGIYIYLEDSSNFMRKRGRSSTLPPSPQKEPTFSCPICMGPLVEEMSTKCGHIFCKVCITKAIAARNKCPTCRKKITSKNIFRIYLPATNSS